MKKPVNVIPTKDGKPYYVDSEGEYWRAYVFIENTVSYDLIDNPEILYEGGLAFGRFQSMLMIMITTGYILEKAGTSGREFF